MHVIKRLKWHKDPTLDLIELDPYSHWMLAYGRDFDFNALETIEVPGDFSYLAVIDELGFDSKIKSTALLADMINFRIDPKMPRTEVIERVAKEVSQLKRQGEASDIPRQVFRLPLRRRSVGELAAPDDDGRLPDVKFESARPERPPEIDPDRTMVITAVIDDHINVVHHRFRTQAGTRIDFAWFQDGVLGGGVPFGRELTKPEIDAVLVAQDAPTDDIRLRKLGLIDFSRPGHNPLALRATHGTHVLDLAAGASADENATNWRIISVSLPSLVTFETSGAFLGFFFLMGLQYILKRAHELSHAYGMPASLVINCSYGIAGGPHDGGHLVERTIEHLLTEFRSRSDNAGEGAGNVTVELVLPAGNGNLDRGHAAITAGDEDKAAAVETRVPVAAVFPWRLQPGDLTSSYLEIWLPDDAEDLEVRTQVPGGFNLPLDLSRRASLLCEGIDENGLPLNPVARVHLGPGSNGRQRIVIAAGPTAVTDGVRRSAPAGLWKITVSAKLNPGERIEAWVQRDASPIGSRVQGRQSYFDDPEYLRFDTRGRVLAVDPPVICSIVRRAGTLNGVATGPSPIVVAGYAKPQEGLSAAPYSGTGIPGGRCPDIAAISDRSRVRVGVLAAGTNSGSRLAINGTSVAAPQVARRRAETGLNGRNLAVGLLDEAEGSVVLDPTDSRRIRIGGGWLA